MIMRSTAKFAHKSWPGVRFLTGGLIKKRYIYQKYPLLTINQNKRTISSDIMHGLMSCLGTYYEEGYPTDGNKRQNENFANREEDWSTEDVHEVSADSYNKDEHIPTNEAKINASRNSINVIDIDALSKEDALEILAVLHGAPPLYQPTSACRCDMCNKALLDSFSNR